MFKICNVEYDIKGGDSIFTLSRNELEIVQLLWKEEKPLSRAEIIEHSPDRSWKASSIHILLNSLLKKGAIEVSGFVRTGKNYGRTYVASLTREEYTIMQISKTLPEVKQPRNRVTGIFAALVHGKDIDRDILHELQEMIDVRKGELDEEDKNK